MSKKYFMKLTNNKSVKIIKNEIYSCNYDQGFDIRFQEQPSNISEPVHTHVWVSNEENGFYIEKMWELFHSFEMLQLPLKTRMFAFLTGFEVVDSECKGPDYTFEFVLDRKLSETLIHNVEDWFFDITEVTLNHIWMRSLFNELGE